MLANSRSIVGSVVGQVAGPAVGDVRVAIDGEDLVVGLPGAGLVRVGEPRRDDGRPPDDRLAERVEGVADVRAEQVADGHRIEESPGIDVAIEPGLERGVVHRVPPQRGRSVTVASVGIAVACHGRRTRGRPT